MTIESKGLQTAEQKTYFIPIELELNITISTPKPCIEKNSSQEKRTVKVEGLISQT